MIIKFQKFNEELVIGQPLDIREGERVVGVGTIDHYSQDGNYHIDIDGQTGIVYHIQRGAYMFYGVIFDNYFCPVLSDLDGRVKIKRCVWVGQKYLKKVEPTEDKPVIHISRKLKQLLEYIEYVGRPFFGENIDYVDISDNPDSVTYMPKERIPKLGFDDDQWDNKYRQTMRVGRFLQIINSYTDQKSLDKKINIYKSVFNNIIMNKYTFKIVRGEEIKRWYDERSYYEGTGSLNKSCMRGEEAQNKLNIYTENPDKVGLLIMLNEDNKLIGRSLLWNVDEPKMIYMDRPYTVFGEDKETFETYAHRNNISFWNDVREDLYVFLNRNYGSPHNNPYMDTFRIFCTEGDKGKNYLTTAHKGLDKYVIYDEA